MRAASRKPDSGFRWGAVFGRAGWLAVLLTLAGCSDPLVRHSLLTTFFDGVPELPPVEQLCEEHMGDKYAEFYAALAEQQAATGEVTTADGKRRIASSHPPFVEKNCDGCHNFRATNRLIRPREELCFVCHRDFVTTAYVHGPVAVGDCLACHLPHDSAYGSLLQEPKSEICAKCHQEERLAARMHRSVIDHNMDCVDCHDPHGSNAQYFLR